MKAMQKDKQIAAYAMIAAPIDETNVHMPRQSSSGARQVCC